MPYQCIGDEVFTEGIPSNNDSFDFGAAENVRPIPRSLSATPSEAVKQLNKELVQSLLASLHCSIPDPTIGYRNCDGAVFRTENSVIFVTPSVDDPSKFSNSIFRLSSHAFATSMSLKAYRLIRGKQVEGFPLALTKSVIKEASLSAFFPLQYDFLIIRLNDLVFDKTRLLHSIPCISLLKAQISMLPLISEPSCQFSVGYPGLVIEIDRLESLSSASARQSISVQAFLKKINPNGN
jgi:hypothetical protein